MFTPRWRYKIIVGLVSFMLILPFNLLAWTVVTTTVQKTGSIHTPTTLFDLLALEQSTPMVPITDPVGFSNSTGEIDEGDSNPSPVTSLLTTRASFSRTEFATSGTTYTPFI